MTEQEEVLLRIRADVEQAAENLQRVASLMEMLASVVPVAGKSLGALSLVFGGIGGKIVVFNNALQASAMVVKGVTAALGMLQKATTGQAAAFAEWAEQVHNATHEVGVSADFYQKLQQALVRTGRGTGEATSSIMRFNRSLQEAREGGDKAREVFRKLGVDISETRSIEDIYANFAEQLVSVESASKRTAYAVEVLGRNGAAQIPVFIELTARLRETAGTISEEMINAGLRYDAVVDKIKENSARLGKEWAALKTQAMTPLVEETGRFHGSLTTLGSDLVWVGSKAVWFGQVMWNALSGNPLAGTVDLSKLDPAEKLKEIGVAADWTTDQLRILAGVWGEVADAENNALIADVRRSKGSLAALDAELGAQKQRLEIEYQQQLLHLEGDDQSKAETVRAMDEAIGQRMDALELTHATRRKQLEFDTQQAITKTALGSETARWEQANAIEEAALRARAESRQISQLELLRGEQELSDRLYDVKIAAAKEEALFAENVSDEGARAAAQAKIEQLENEKVAARANSNAKIEATETLHQQSLSRITIEGERDRSISQLELQRSGAQQQVALHLMTQQEFLKIDQQITDQIYSERIRAAEEQLAKIPEVELDRYREAVEAIKRLKEEQAKAVVDSNAAIIASEEEFNDRMRGIYDQVDSLHAQAFGTESEQRTLALVQAHDRLIEQLTRQGGMEDSIQRVHAAYGQMISDAQVGTIDLTNSIKTGLADAFEGIVLGTRKPEDFFKGLKQSFVSQWTQAFTDVLFEKSGFDAKLNLNFTEQIPGMAAQGAEKTGNIWGSVFNLISGGGGGAGRVSVSPGGGGATWVGGTPSSTGIVGGATFPASAGSVGGGTGGSRAAGSGMQGLGNILGSFGGGGGGMSLGGLGASAGSAASGYLLYSALTGGWGKFGSAMPLSIMAGLSGVPGVASGIGALGGLAGGLGNLASSFGLGGMVSSIGGYASMLGNGISSLANLAGLTSTAIAPLGAAGALTSVAPMTGAAGASIAIPTSGVTGAGAVGSGVGAVSSAVSYIPIIGWIVAGVLASLNASDWLDKRNSGITGAAGLNDDEVYKAFWGGALGKIGSSKFVGPVLGSALTGFVPTSKFGFDPFTEFLKGVGIAHVPTAGTQSKRFFDEVIGEEKGLRDILRMGGMFPKTGPKGTHLDYAEYSERYAPFKGEAKHEENRGILEALGLTALATNFPEGGARGTPFSVVDVKEFASRFIRNAGFVDMPEGVFNAQVEEVVKKMAGEGSEGFAPALGHLNRAFKNPDFMAGHSEYETDTPQQLYANSVAELADFMIKELPNAAKDVIRDIASAGTVEIDEVNKLVGSILVSRDMVESALGDTFGGMLEEGIDAEEAEEQRRKAATDRQNEQLNRQQRIKDLETSIQQAQLFGDEVTAAVMAMEAGTLRAAELAKEATETVLTPAQQLVESVNKGLREDIVANIVNSIAESGFIQVATAPIYAAMGDLSAVLSNPNATQAEIDAAIATFNAALTGAGPGVAVALDRGTQIAASVANSGVLGFEVPAMAAGGIVNMPTLAMIGENGPEAVIPLGRGSGAAGIVINVNVTGNTIIDDRTAATLARRTSEQMVRDLRQNMLV